ncbi:MAG: hypothetical protein J6C51_06300 [Clostridia bacterium]|nr:hypothetical protein [Clostridia bacterium]
MKNRQPRAKMNIPMLCACVLLCLTLFSFHLTGGLYARYTTRAEAADNARVAKFSVTETGLVLSESIRLHIDPDTEAEAIFTIDNDSEVRIRCKIQANNPYENLPLKFQISMGGQIADALEGVEIAPDAAEDCKLVVSWDGAADYKYMGRVDLVELTLITEQVD